ncbi:cytochrome b [Aquabacter spiritensis]|uniref:Cytochrome b561 n=1 Tax=Aquabacter spiritensis TaxID=933073 RepID=A0A4R3M857_9HYPH|nr:cytochrome b [Aquabacter spiritensis]TCT07525.1 cytochrome b561 [Aquabacter spiritensis]
MDNGTITPYARPARWIHWINAALVLLVIPFGFVMVRLPAGAAQNQVFDLHRSIGFAILCLAVVRVAVRIAYGAPPPAPGLPHWQRVASQATHHLLYVLIFLMPLLGWGASSAFGAQVSVFGLFTLPDLVPKDEALSRFFGGAHVYLGFFMTALVALHIGAALMHGIVRRDGVLSRMLPGLSRT